MGEVVMQGEKKRLKGTGEARKEKETGGERGGEARREEVKTEENKKKRTRLGITRDRKGKKKITEILTNKLSFREVSLTSPSREL